jgi:hypothetical protein
LTQLSGPTPGRTKDSMKVRSYAVEPARVVISTPSVGLLLKTLASCL